MMDSGRRRRSDNYNQEVARARSHDRKPPLGNWQQSVPSWERSPSGNRQQTVPSWERRFCTVVGSLPWRNILDAKKFIHLYDNVLKWNDSAGEEAFINAKNRFWAHINGLPCQIPSPDPDIYNDKIDWNANVDPQLILDLESEPIAPENQEKAEPVVIMGGLFSDNLYSPSGWGDAEDDMKKTGFPSENKENPWESDSAHVNESVRQKSQNGWGDVCNDSWCANQDTGVAKNSGWEDGWNQWENKNHESNNSKYGTNSGVWQPWDHGNQENTGGCMSRYKTSRFRGDDKPTNREWRNGKGRKSVNFVCELPYVDNRQRNLMNSCTPIRHNGSAERGHQWRWEKPVS